MTDLRAARWHRLGAFEPAQWDDLEHLRLVANTLRLALEQPQRVEPVLDQLYARIGELSADDEAEARDAF